MRNPTSLVREGNSMAAGIRAAVLVVVLGVFAAAIDNVSLWRHEVALPAHDPPPVVMAAKAAVNRAEELSLQDWARLASPDVGRWPP